MDNHERHTLCLKVTTNVRSSIGGSSADLEAERVVEGRVKISRITANAANKS